jgi:hypothetical protein
MTQRATMAVLAVAMAFGCQKESGGGGASGGASGGTASALDYPSDTTLLVGFVRKGPAPSAAQLNAAVEAMIGEKPDKEMSEVVDTCVAPISAHLERTTIALRGSLTDQNVVVWASGSGLKPAVEACWKAMADKRGKSFAPGTDGPYTVYAMGGDGLLARWTGDDQVVMGAKKDQIESAIAAKGGLKGSPLEKVVSEIDRSASVWLAAAGPGLPEKAGLEWASGTIQDLTGSVHAVFKSPEAATQAGGMAQMVIPKGVKIEGNELKIGVNLVDLSTLIPDRKGPPLSPEHARAILASGPLMLGFFLVAGGSQDVQPAPTTEAVPAPEPPAATSPP